MKSKETKRKEAEARHAAYDALTPQQKLDRLGDLNALRERMRIAKDIRADAPARVAQLGETPKAS